MYPKKEIVLCSVEQGRDHSKNNTFWCRKAPRLAYIFWCRLVFKAKFILTSKLISPPFLSVGHSQGQRKIAIVSTFTKVSGHRLYNYRVMNTTYSFVNSKDISCVVGSTWRLLKSGSIARAATAANIYRLDCGSGGGHGTGLLFGLCLLGCWTKQRNRASKTQIVFLFGLGALSFWLSQQATEMNSTNEQKKDMGAQNGQR